MFTERATNPFLRTDQTTIKTAAEHYAGRAMTNRADTFATIRRMKNSF
jgi:hypothetical protein